jgi:death on curing protein
MSVKLIPSEIIPIIHTDLINHYGGQHGLRDSKLLDSALAQPKMSYGGKYVHRTIFDKAAAYGFHICNNHPFLDGNKRLAFVLMDIFLQMNGYILSASEKDAYSTMMELANGRFSKKQLSVWLKSNSVKLKMR